MQKVLKNIIKKLLFHFLPKDRVLFESYPDFADNTRCVYDDLVRRGYNKKYQFVWILQDDDPERCPKDDNVFCISLNDEKAYSYHVRRAKAVISCNRILASYVPEQFSIYLDHGSPFKQYSKYLFAPRNAHLGYYLSTSQQTESIRAECLKLLPDTEIISFGFPRNDAFSEKRVDLCGVFGRHYDKIIAWYPTFRNQKYEERNEGADTLPIIHESESAYRLNEIADQTNTLIVFKPHPVQDVSYVRSLELSNIRFIDDVFLSDHQLTSYAFLNSCDALISDYSGVIVDYTLADKPIGLIWEDIEKYKKDLGLVRNYEFLASGSEKIYNIEELITFVKNVSEGVDKLRDQRRVVRDYCHCTVNGGNTERVVDFIIERAGL